jgi:hypothetical protein
VAPGAAVKPVEMAPLAVLPVRSVIARPLDGSEAGVGPQEVVGVAFAGGAAIRRVEVSVDRGASWQEAALEGEGGPGRWQVFRHRFEARQPGAVRAMARATDAQGNVQPREPGWNPGGYLWNGWHSVAWTVRA